MGWGGEGGGALETHKLSSGYCNRPLGGGGLVQHGLHEGNQFRRRKRGGGMREGGRGRGCGGDDSGGIRSDRGGEGE